MSADSVAQDPIVAFVERILRLKEEADAIKADIREVYAEAKGNGFDKTALGKLVSYIEKRQSAPNAVAEAEALFDLYLTAYDSAKGRPSHTHAYAHVKHDAATGEIIEPQPPQSPAAQVDANTSGVGSRTVGNATSPAGVEATVDPQPSQANADDEATATAGAIRPAEVESVSRPSAGGGTGAPVIYAAPGEVVMETTPPEPVRWHQYANCFPTVVGNDLTALEADIHNTSGGVTEPIVKIGNHILDGRARYGIARSMRIPYPVVQYAGDDALRDVIALNLESRALSEHDRAVVAGKLAKLVPERKDEIGQLLGLQQVEESAA